MSIKPDHWIERMALEHGMIKPFIANQVEEGVISYGLSSYGYDIRVANEFKIFTNVNTTVVDPKNFDPLSLVDFRGDVCIIPPNSFALAQTVEYFRIPRDIMAICVGKSTYARCGLILNTTPFEACFSSDTEILTKSGWQTFDKILIGTEVLTRNQAGIAEWQQVTRIQSYLYDGELLHFDGRNSDLLVTPEHSLLVSFRDSNKNTFSDWKLLESKDIFGKYNYRFNRKVLWIGQDIDNTITIGKREYDTNSFLWFFGAYLGDGSAYVSKSKKNYTIKLAGLKERKKNSYKEIIKKLGHKPGYDGRSTVFLCKDLMNYLRPLGHAHEKYILNWIRELPPYRLQFLIDGMIFSDGNEETRAYSTTSKELANNFQEVLFKAGYAAIVRNTGKGKPTEINGQLVKANYDRYIIRQCFTQLTPKTRPANHKRQSYIGPVYDVTVPNHVIFVRRNGKAIWSGNCWEGYATLEISNTTPLPAKIYANEGIAQVLFFQSDEDCLISYADKKGKYQKQMGITLPVVKR